MWSFCFNINMNSFHFGLWNEMPEVVSILSTSASTERSEIDNGLAEWLNMSSALSSFRIVCHIRPCGLEFSNACRNRFALVEFHSKQQTL
jgi:hypothetical protein